MQTLFSRFKLFSILVCVLVLAGCSNMGQYLTQISNKNPDAVKSENVQSGGQNTQCNTWCHNGWCSTHCEKTS